MTKIAFRHASLTHWPRKFTTNRRRSAFDSSYSQTLDLLGRELNRLDAKNVVLQVALEPRDIRLDGLPRADARSPKHPGVILSFGSKHGPLSYACDAFVRWECNLRGIALTLERLRMADLYGVTQSGEQYKGWAALPDPDAPVNTAAGSADFLARHGAIEAARVLASPNHFQAAYRAAARRLHPDAGGDTAQFQKLQEAQRILKLHHGV
jgi:hypothetical protein